MIALDITVFISELKSDNESLREVPTLIDKAIQRNLIKYGLEVGKSETLNDFLLYCVQKNTSTILL